MANIISRRTFLQASTVAGFGATSLFGFQQSFDNKNNFNFDEIRNKIKKEVSDGSPMSLVVAVAKDGKIIWEEAFGWADREQKIPATVKTRYPVASVSKPLTALGIMVLVERGLVNLDDPVKEFLGDLKLTAYEGEAETVTIKHLLQHTSGLPRHWHTFYADENETPLKFEETIHRYGILVNVPGAEHLYTNLGYGLLAHIIERISGKTFSEFMLREVFLPLNLNDTTIENATRISRPTAALYNADGTFVPRYTVDDLGSMSVVSSVQDIIKFGMFHLKTNQLGQKQIIKAESIDRMMREKQTIGDLDSADYFYALGWNGREKSTHSYYNLGHSGDAPGISSLLTILPDEKIAVATIANTRFSDLIYTVSDDILDALLPDNKKMRESDPTLKPKDTPIFKMTGDLLGQWTGEIKTYSGTIPSVMTFQPDGDIHFKLEGQLETLVSQIRFESGKLTGRCMGTITTEDAMHRPHQLRFVLKLKGGILSGTVHAQSSTGSQAKNLPKRDYFALASRITLTKNERK